MSSVAFQGQFGTAWWTQEWLAPLVKWEQWDPERLQRAMMYARRGLVRQLQVNPGRLVASVQDARPLPYDVKVEVPVWTPSQIQVLAHWLASEAVFLGELLHQRLPKAMRAVLQQTPGAPALAPMDLSDLHAECTCPDRGLLCSHILATWLAFAQRIEVDPWALLGLRGASREELLQLVQSAHDAQSRFDSGGGQASAGVQTEVESRPREGRNESSGVAAAAVRTRAASDRGLARTRGVQSHVRTALAATSPGQARWSQLSLAEAAGVVAPVRTRRPLTPPSPLAAWERDREWAQPLLAWADALDQWSAQPSAAPSGSETFWVKGAPTGAASSTTP